MRLEDRREASSDRADGAESGSCRRLREGKLAAGRPVYRGGGVGRPEFSRWLAPCRNRVLEFHDDCRRGEYFSTVPQCDDARKSNRPAALDQGVVESVIPPATPALLTGVNGWLPGRRERVVVT